MKAIREYPGLYATKEGVIYGSNNKGGQPCKPRVYSQFKDTQGYLYISYYGNNIAVHRLVLLAFRGECPPNCEGCHYDDNKENNALDNLRWGTRVENCADKIRNNKHHKIVCRGELNVNAILTDNLVIELRKLYDTGTRICDISKRYGIKYNTVSDVVKRINWKHIL